MRRAKLSASIVKEKPRRRPQKHGLREKVDELNLSGNIAENWRLFRRNFEIFAVAVEQNNKTKSTSQ